MSYLSKKFSDLAYDINWADDVDLDKLRRYVETLAETCCDLAQEVDDLRKKVEEKN